MKRKEGKKEGAWGGRDEIEKKHKIRAKKQTKGNK